MNVLLVMPKTISNEDDWYVFPTGIAYVSSALKASNICNVYTTNLNYAKNPKDTILHLINKFNIELVATGGLAIQYASLKEVVSTVKQANRSIITVMGGAFISGDPIVAMNSIPEIDYGIIGEGEITICELVSSIINNGNLSDVLGIIYKKPNGDLVITKKRNPISNIDNIEYPDYDGFDFNKLLPLSPVNFGIYGTHSAVLLTSRGCPFHCSFCYHPQGDLYRRRSLDSVFKELEWLIEKYKIESVLFLDELFGGNQKWLNDFCTRMQQYKIQWWVETRVEFATLENLRLMKESGCVQVLLGIENINNSILKSMRKKITQKDIETALKNTYEVGISSPGMLLFGDPAETLETAENTFRWWEEHSMYNITLTTVQVYPGSQLWDYAIQSGLLPTLESQVRYLQHGCPKLNLTKLSNNEYTELCKRISLCNKSKNPFIIDARALDKKWSNNKLTANVQGYCSRCGKPNLWKKINLLSEGGGSESFICSECGQSHSNPFFEEYYNNAVNNIINICSKYKHVAILGQCRHFLQMYVNWNRLRELGLLFFTTSPSKSGEKFFDNTLFLLSDMNDFELDAIIIAVGDVNYQYALAAINQTGTKAKLFSLTELFKKHNCL